MYDVYTVNGVAEKLPNNVADITCIGASDGEVLVGTKSGRIYRYVPEDSFYNKWKPSTYSLSNKKPITQICVEENFDILIFLADPGLSVHSTLQQTYPLLSTVPKSRGATFFATQSLTGDNKVQKLYLAVASRHRIQLFEWANQKEFVEIRRVSQKDHQPIVDKQPIDLSFPDRVRCMTWCGYMLAVAVRDEYIMVQAVKSTDKNNIENIEPGQMTSLCNTGSNRSEPNILALNDEKVIAFSRDESLVFYDFQCRKADATFPTIHWTESPQQLAYDSPFLFGLLSNRIEIRTVKPVALIQTIVIATKPKFIISGTSFQVEYGANNFNGSRPRAGSRFQVFASGNHDIWCLSGNSKSKMTVEELYKDKQYELAIKVAEKSGKETEAGKRALEIKRSYAFHLYTQKKFEASFTIYLEVKEEVVNVIGLFPDLLPSDVNSRLQLKYPGKLHSALSDTERKEGLRALAKYLVEVRITLAKELADQQSLRQRQRKGEKDQLSGVPDVHGLPERGRDTPSPSLKQWDDHELDSNRGLLEIVDTVLLACYLETNELLIASLIRLADNSCNVPVAEKALSNRGKFHELYLLYEKKGMHEEAMDLLKTQSKMPNFPLQGLDTPILYLQGLGPEYMSVIFKHASWIIEADVKEGIKIFTEDCKEVKALDRHSVLKYLELEARQAVIPYLEHVIYYWKEDYSIFHDTLAHHYLSNVKRLLEEFLHALPEGHEIPAPGKEPGELGQYRKRLLYFLNTSTHYNPETLLVCLPHEILYEERALILGKLKRHEQAIAIYTNILLDYDAAEAYANHHYSTNKADRDVYLTLLRMYADPVDNSILGLMQSHNPKPKPNVALALKVLKNFAGRIDTVKGVELLPGDIRLDELWVSIEAVLQQTANKRRREEINRNLYYACLLRAQEKLMKAENKLITINYVSSCTECNKKISNSAFVRCPDGSLVHYFCHKQKTSQDRKSDRR